MSRRLILGAALTGALIVVVTAAFIFDTSKVAYLSGHVSRQQTTLSHQVNQIRKLTSQVDNALHNQTANRAVNVGTWCNAINGLQNQLLAYVNRISIAASKRHPGTHYSPTLGLTLKHLNCQTLEQKTTNSASKYARNP